MIMLSLSKVIEWIEFRYGSGKAQAVSDILQDKNWYQMSKEERKEQFERNAG